MLKFRDNRFLTLLSPMTNARGLLNMSARVGPKVLSHILNKNQLNRKMQGLGKN